MGSNMAEAHPVAFRFVMEAKKRGATVIHADPRFTRTSAMADLYAPIRAGTDIAFLSGIIHHLLEHDLWFREYAMHYTNIATLIDERYAGPAERDGLFSGWDEAGNKYTYDSWQYKGGAVPSSLAEHYVNTTENFSSQVQRLQHHPPEQDHTLSDPHCVYQIMRRHYAPYTPEMVERVTGCPRDVFLKVAEALARNSGRERTSAICYAVGWTQHTTGVQMIRAAAIVQGLLGNVGRPGGGILALRGHCSIQGSTDVPTLYNLLPGYLTMPHAFKTNSSLADYLEAEQVPTGWWHHLPKYLVSLLRAWYGDAASRDNDWGFEWLPKIVGDHSQLPMTLAMRDGLIRGLFLMGQNPVVGGHNSRRVVQRGLANLEWLVVRDFTETESASFWYASDMVKDGERSPRDIATEVFLLPASIAAGEKAGSFTNTHRLLQWHDQVVDAPGDCRSDLWFLYHLGRRLKTAYADSADPRDRPMQALTWDYPVEGTRREPSAQAVLKEINGYTWPERKPLESYRALADDGSTACGVWIYSGVYPEEGRNLARARNPDPPGGPGTHLGWGYAWPNNVRNLNNRASADPEGRPWSERKKYVWWDAQQGRWTGADTPDFEPDKSPQYRQRHGEPDPGMAAIEGHHPFIMIADGKCSLYVPSGLKDGPLPAHYEPVESPVRNPVYAQQDNPVAKKWDRDGNRYHPVGDPEHPHVLVTYRLTEHHCGAAPTRNVATLAELQPEGFAEIPPELAREHGIEPLDWIVVSTTRGEVETRALVTERLRPYQIDGRRVYVIGMPWHYGYQGYATGGIVNTLTSVVGEPNTSIHEGKVLTCALRRGRIGRRPGSGA